MLLMAVLDLVGVFFNIRMLRSCFKDKTKYKFLQKCRVLVIFQSAYQVTILVTNAVESWKLLLDIQPRESCNVFRALSNSMMFLQACNLTAIYIMAQTGNQEVFSKLQISAAQSLGFIASAVIWYSCSSRGFLTQTALTVLSVVAVVFVVLLFVAVARNSIHEELEDTTPEASMKKSSLLWNVCKENRRSIFFMVLSLTCLAVVLSGSTPGFIHVSVSQKQVLYSLINIFVFDIILPLTICDLIDSSFEDWEDNKKQVEVI